MEVSKHGKEIQTIWARILSPIKVSKLLSKTTFTEQVCCSCIISDDQYAKVSNSIDYANISSPDEPS